MSRRIKLVACKDNSQTTLEVGGKIDKDKVIHYFHPRQNGMYFRMFYYWLENQAMFVMCDRSNKLTSKECDGIEKLLKHIWHENKAILKIE